MVQYLESHDVELKVGKDGHSKSKIIGCKFNLHGVKIDKESCSCTADQRECLMVFRKGIQSYQVMLLSTGRVVLQKLGD